jgi:FKBP-type peptidyl-prolyl cis-trans isomerase
MNRKNVFSVLSIALATGAMVLVGCEKPADLNSDKGQYSYAIGVQISKNLKEQGVDLDIKAFAEGAADVYAGKDLKMKDDVRMAALQKMSQAMRGKEAEVAKDNLAKGQAYLDANKAKDGVKTTASGLQYKIVTEGTGPTPKASDEVEVNYRGKLIDGKEFDSSYSRNQPAQFPVGHVIPGWTEALQLMKVGSKAELVIPPNLAYGDRGNPSIPPNSVLVFEVELLKIVKNDTAAAGPGGKPAPKTKKK